jgi:hypothetical protein
LKLIVHFRGRSASTVSTGESSAAASLTHAHARTGQSATP